MLVQRELWIRGVNIFTLTLTENLFILPTRFCHWVQEPYRKAFLFLHQDNQSSASRQSIVSIKTVNRQHQQPSDEEELDVSRCLRETINGQASEWLSWDVTQRSWEASWRTSSHASRVRISNTVSAPPTSRNSVTNFCLHPSTLHQQVQYNVYITMKI